MKERRLVFCGRLGPRATGIKRLGRETGHLTAIWFRGQEWVELYLSFRMCPFGVLETNLQL